ncbi:tRNA-guanine transglycosylase [Hortaea werneckii]|nr:tRNA-guanine transglycosylase [Hortaea werneckii]KAI6995800.1 tRNA-guanine transglycosylase [Hortaea werneckii]KAI7147496.1 tRNA-guanine transglycosylase [Hortaea werneckii]KAI7176195.1 tRNA-guanine transglycosylase [Hortaea werneckii]KAI7195428.1 tRNA-guanine transglycosylase [Hortaea werneckii]
MAGVDGTAASNTSNEMFSLSKVASTGLGPRLGRLKLPNHNHVDTPHYLGVTSRGVIPHLTPDSLSAHTSISGVYVGLEDCPRLTDQGLVLTEKRRTPPVAAPAANSNTDERVSVCTAVGFKNLRAEEYAPAVEKLGADIVVGLGDIPYGRALGSKRVEKGTDRMINWITEHVALRLEAEQETPAGLKGKQARFFAPLLPVSCANQRFYVETLTDELKGCVDGLAIYDTVTLEDMPTQLVHLPRLAFTTPATPHDVLQQVALGFDFLTIPFITAATDAGIALDFSLPALERLDENTDTQDSQSLSPKPLGTDMWSTSHSTSLTPLAENCTCYACTNHHCAYIQHLLVAKEMLGWVLLQIHNHHILDRFFDGIRKTISTGTFEQERERFARVYEKDLPEKTGQGPRVRGYQFKSEGPGEPKKNTPNFKPYEDGKTLNDGEEVLADSASPRADANAVEMERTGFAERAD